MNQENVIVLKESLDKKLAILQEIQRICKQQTDVLDSEPMDYELFDQLMNDRDVCIEKLEKIDEGFVKVFERVRADIDANKKQYEEIIKEIKALISDTTDSVATINALDARNRNKLENVFIREKRSASESKRSVNVAMNYYKNMLGMETNGGMHMDKKK